MSGYGKSARATARHSPAGGERTAGSEVRAAADLDHLAGDPAGAGAGEEGGRPRDVLRLRHPAQRRCLGRPRLRVRVRSSPGADPRLGAGAEARDVGGVPPPDQRRQGQHH